jgi:hypothetical protein
LTYTHASKDAYTTHRQRPDAPVDFQRDLLCRQESIVEQGHVHEQRQDVSVLATVARQRAVYRSDVLTSGVARSAAIFEVEDVEPLLSELCVYVCVCVCVCACVRVSVRACMCMCMCWCCKLVTVCTSKCTRSTHTHTHLQRAGSAVAGSSLRRVRRDPTQLARDSSRQILKLAWRAKRALGGGKPRVRSGRAVGAR